MASSNPLGSGIIRTESGRMTYAPDGIVSSSSSPNIPRSSGLSHSSTLNPNEKEHLKDDNSSGAIPGPSNEDRDIEKQSQNEKSKGEKNGDDEEEKDPNVVDWDGDDDKTNPMNWNPKRKWTIAVCMGLMTLVVTFASSVFSSATQVTAMQFGVSAEVMILGLALFVLGFAFGPIVWVCRIRFAFAYGTYADNT